MTKQELLNNLNNLREEYREETGSEAVEEFDVSDVLIVKHYAAEFVEWLAEKILDLRIYK